MIDNLPLVTIAIPTFNRARLLARSISSAQKQTHTKIEIVISDNGSSDGTELLCREMAALDSRIRYFRQPKNVGGTGNFNWLLSQGSGTYFMWLGDDDWIDDNYVESCLDILRKDPSLVSASGHPVYYKNGKPKFIGRIFDVTHPVAKWRIAHYLFRVTDNGVFYGLFRKASIVESRLPDKFAGDWYFFCDVLTAGGFRMTKDTHVHRELGGATESYKKLAALYGLPSVASFFPSYYAARGFLQHTAGSQRLLSLKLGRAWAVCLSLIILSRPLTNIPYRLRRKLQTIYSKNLAGRD